MSGLTPDKILAQLGPSSPPGIIWNILLYIIFFLAVIAMFMQSDKQNIPTILLGAVGAMAVIAKLGVFEPKAFGSLVINAGMFVTPFIVAGISKAKKSIPLCIFTGIVAGLFFFGFWLVLQRGGG